ncbi:YfkD family protein [Camelliibacillus cellulosilyticus]|uniref:YfkD family protein n=1 Tax=Camelliibacillus cellulosilyticus TaxID=2174486 RepID=A0ABV9GMA7_9BACL
MKKFLIALCVSLLVSSPAVAKEHKAPKPPKQTKQVPETSHENIRVPKSVVDISKLNTYPNPTQNEPELQPSPMAKGLLKNANVPIENLALIRLLNESTIHTSKLSIGYRAKIYLGNWPLNYQSNKTTINWEYKKINENRVDNRGTIQPQKLVYFQEEQAKVMGGLTAQVPDENEVKKLMMMKASSKIEMPIAFTTYVGRGTKIDRIYQVAPKKVGHLFGFVPAVNEKGKVTYGEVYLVLKGGSKRIEVKNITQQGIGAWIPIQDYIALRYNSTN